MTTIEWPRSCRALQAALLLALAALLGACGPGVGGTGTGEEITALQDFGAAPASVCSGELAALAACTGAGAAAAPASAGVYLADTFDGRRVRVHLQGDGIDVDAPCARLRFRGRWGVVGSQAGRFYGSATVDGVLQPATLTAQPVSGGAQLTVRDAQGVTLLGPVLVEVVPVLVTPGGCG